MSEKYYYKSNAAGRCLEVCNVRKKYTEVFPVRIGSFACRNCECNLEKGSKEDYIVCSRIDEATGKTPVK